MLPSTVQISAFRYWIQGYPNFYEPIVMEYFQTMGYRALRRPAAVGKADIQRIIDALFDGTKRLGRRLDSSAIQKHLRGRKRLQPDLLLEREGRLYLAEMKSWGGSRSGVFNLATAQAEFLGTKDESRDNSAFLLVDQLEGQAVAGKILVVSACSAEHAHILALLRDSYRTEIELLYLDEILRTPQLAGLIERQLRYLDAAVAELKQALS